MDKETKLRSVLFLVVGFLLILSLIICIHIVSKEKNLVPVEAVVYDVIKDSEGVGIDTIYIKYTVDSDSYDYTFNTKKDYQINQKLRVYYESKDPHQVKYSKTSKLIFLCPIIGLSLCALGLFELYKRNNDGEDEFKTSIIGVVGNSEQLKIVSENDEPQAPVEDPVTVKTISEPVEEEVPEKIVEEPKEIAEPVVEPIPEPVKEEIEMPAPAVVEEPELPAAAPEVQNVEEVSNVKEEVKKEEKEEKASLEDTLMEKVKEKNGDKIEVSESELKEAIKDVLADVIKEVKEEKKAPKEVVQVRIIPNYYYISGTSLLYEQPGKEQKELDLKDINKVVRTVNEAGNVVKLVVESPEVKCILTNMKNIDLEQLANLLRNKMRTIDENFEEVIEHKEY